jgi:hypothetical protein
MSNKNIFLLAVLVVSALVLIGCQGIPAPVTVVETVEVEKEVVVTATPLPKSEGEGSIFEVWHQFE